MLSSDCSKIYSGRSRKITALTALSASGTSLEELMELVKNSVLEKTCVLSLIKQILEKPRFSICDSIACSGGNDIGMSRTIDIISFH
ncbi:hypothetical protein XENTR_v10019120 [Xenopus tropicalis]|nr:hypothetical protein XENTR_v10019120 [Xenopus tropicalis]